MNIKFRTFLGLLALSVTLLTSCLDSDKTTLSDNAKITRFIIYNDSIAGLDHIVLTIDNDNNTIYNADSLAYGTVLDSVYLDIYGSTLASIIINDSITYEDSLIVDLNQPLLVRSFAKNMVAYRDYTVTVSVHQVEPELFVWDGLVTQLSELPQSSEKGVYFNETLFYYYNTSSGISAKSSVNGKSWSSVSCNLPATTQLEELVNYGDKLAVVVDNVLYVSSDGSSWSSVSTTGETVEMALFTLNGTLYGLTTSDIVSLSATNE